MFRDLLSDLRYRLRALFRRGDVERDLADEIQFHLDHEAEKLAARGAPPDDARRRARLAFGGVEQTKEAARDARGVRWVEQLAQDSKYAVRSLRKNPGFVVTSVLTIALGIGLTTAVYSVADRLILNPLPFTGGDRLGVFVFTQADGQLVNGIPSQLLADWSQRATSFEFISPIVPHGGFFTAPGHATVASGRSVASSLLNALGVTPVIGRNFGPADMVAGTPRVIMLSEQFWRSEFHAQRDVLGMQVALNDTTYTVVGVVPDVLDAIERYTPMAFWMPLSGSDAARLGSGARAVYGIARLKPGLPVQRAEDELKLFMRQWALARGWKGSPALAVPTVVQPSALLASSLRSSIWTLLGATALVMLIACANVASLQLVRARRRAGEFAIRVALGAPRGRLIRQLFFEAMIVTATAGLAGVVIGWWTLRALALFHPQQLVQLNALGFDRTDLAFSLGLVGATSLIFGIVPGWVATGDCLRGALRSVTATGRTSGRNRTQRFVVVAEVALSVTLLGCGGLLTRTYIRLDSADPAFKPDGLVEMMLWLPPAQYGDSTARNTFWSRLLPKVRAIPGVQAVERATPTMLRSNDFTWRPASLEVAQQPGAAGQAKAQVVDARFVPADYFRLLGASLVAGRAFSADEERGKGADVAVIGQGLAHRLWPNGQVIGQRFRLSEKEPWLTVVGVVADIGLVGTDLERKKLQVYQPAGAEPAMAAQFGAPGLIARAQPGMTEAQLLAALERVVRSVDPAVAVNNARTESDVLGGGVAEPRFDSALLGAFSVLAMLLAAVGLYGVIAYAVAQRTHEIGVRIALGATTGDIARWVMGDGMRLAMLGLIVGMAGALAGTRLLANLLYGVSPADPVVFLTIPVVLVAATLLASYLPARRAMRVDPVIALRAE